MSAGRIYEARVEEVHSGDDFILLVNLGVDGLFKRTRVRLHGVDAPNAYKAGPDTEARKVRDEVRRTVGIGAKCLIELVTEGKGGWIVNMTVFDAGNHPVCLNTSLRERGYVYTPPTSRATQDTTA